MSIKIKFTEAYSVGTDDLEVCVWESIEEYSNGNPAVDILGLQEFDRTSVPGEVFYTSYDSVIVKIF